MECSTCEGRQYVRDTPAWWQRMLFIRPRFVLCPACGGNATKRRVEERSEERFTPRPDSAVRPSAKVKEPIRVAEVPPVEKVVLGNVSMGDEDVEFFLAPNPYRKSSPPQPTESVGLTKQETVTLPTDEGLVATLQKRKTSRREIDEALTRTRFCSVSRDGMRIATQRYYDSRIFVIDIGDRKAVSMPGGAGQIHFSSTGRQIAGMSDDRLSIIFYDLETLSPIRQTPSRSGPCYIKTFVWSKDDSKVAVAFEGGFAVLSAADGSTIFERFVSERPIHLAWSRDSTMLAVAHGEKGEVLSGSDGGSLFSWNGPAGGLIRGMSFAHDGSLVAGDSLGHLKRIDVKAQTIGIVSGMASAQAVNVVAAPDSPLLAVGRRDGAFEVWDSRIGRRLFYVSGRTDSEGQGREIDNIEWLPDGRRLCIASGFAETSIWSLPS